jgi:hypothetical protein
MENPNFDPDTEKTTWRRRGILKAGAIGAAAVGGVALTRGSGAEAASLTPVRAFDVREFGAKGNGAADDSDAVQAAVDAAAEAGGIVFFSPGTYRVGSVALKSRVHLRGSGIDATVIRLRDSDDGALFESEGFEDLTGSDSGDGITSFSLRDFTIDGNRERGGNADGLRIFGYGYELTEIVVHSCGGDGIYSEWGSVGSIGEASHEMEARFSGVRSHTNGGNGITFRGPHDSMFVNCLAYHNDGIGFHLAGVSHGSQLTNLHSWGAEQQVAFQVDALAISCLNCYGDIDGGVGVAITRNECQWIGGRVIGSRASAEDEIGLQLGGAGSEEAVSAVIVDTYIQNCGTAAIDLPGDGGRNVIKARVHQEAAPGDEEASFAYLRGAFNEATQAEVTEDVRDTVRNTVVFPAFDLRAELASTPPPADGTARVFSRVEGGRTQLCVTFADGGVQVIAEESGPR